MVFGNIPFAGPVWPMIFWNIAFAGAVRGLGRWIVECAAPTADTEVGRFTRLCPAPIGGESEPS